jgi:hypothetical protein
MPVPQGSARLLERATSITMIPRSRGGWLLSAIEGEERGSRVSPSMGDGVRASRRESEWKPAPNRCDSDFRPARAERNGRVARKGGTTSDGRALSRDEVMAKNRQTRRFRHGLRWRLPLPVQGNNVATRKRDTTLGPKGSGTISRPILHKDRPFHEQSWDGGRYRSVSLSCDGGWFPWRREVRGFKAPPKHVRQSL